MEEEISGLISQHHKAVFTERSHRFSNVLDKLRNAKVGHQVAWSEFQPILSYCVEEYPEKFQELQPTLREVFEIRRDAFFNEGVRADATLNIRKVLASVPDNERDLLDAPMVCVRDLFNVNPPRFRSRI